MINLRVEEPPVIPLSVESAAAVGMTVTEAFIDRGGASIQSNKNVSPAAEQVIVTPDQGYDALAKVTVDPIPSEYIIPSGTKNITANGNGQDVVGYAAVNVNVPNSYSQSDEGKVVQSGALVAQTSDTVTQNGTVDTTLINSLDVNVSGGASGATLLASGSFTGDGTKVASFSIGKKMAQTDFLIRIYVPAGTVFQYNTTKKMNAMGVYCDSTFSYYDLSANGTDIPPTAQDTSYYIYTQNGTDHRLARRPIFGSAQYLVSGSGANVEVLPWANPTITKSASGFSIKWNATSTNDTFVSGQTYNFEILYFGANAATDIVEVA